MATTVLIVDDHPTFRRLARRLIEDAGFTVVGEAVDGASALIAVHELRPDVVLLDVLLPDRSGIEVAGVLAADGNGPVLVLTSSRSARDLGAALDGVPAQFVRKVRAHRGCTCRDPGACMTASRAGYRTPGWWAAGLLGGAVALGYVLGWLDQGTADLKSAYFVLTMATGMLVGLWAWAWRPKTRMGPLMFWWPLLWLASDLPSAYPTSTLAATIGVALFVMGPIAFGQMALSYPLGSLLPGRLAWVYIFILGYAAQVVQNVYNLLFLESCPFCPPPNIPTLVPDRSNARRSRSRPGTTRGSCSSWRSFRSVSTCSIGRTPRRAPQRDAHSAP